MDIVEITSHNPDQLSIQFRGNDAPFSFTFSKGVDEIVDFIARCVKHNFSGMKKLPIVLYPKERMEHIEEIAKSEGKYSIKNTSSHLSQWMPNATDLQG